MQNINKTKLLAALALGLFLILGNIKTTMAAPPQGTNLSAAETYTEDTPLNLIDIVTSDADNDPLTVTLTLSNPAAGSLTTGTSGSVTSTYNAGTGVWTASGAIASINTLLAGVTFVPAANFNSTFIIATSVSDGTTSATGSKTMTGVAVNDGPTATNLNAAETYTEDTSLNLIDIVVSDVDSANITATLTLSNTSAGSLSTGTSGSVTSTYNAGTGTWTASGAIASVNSLLAGVTFVPALNFNSNFTIATSASDGVAPAITGTKAVTGVAVNDAPTATNLSAAESYTQDTPLNLIDIVASDVDSTNITATLSLSNPGAGSLNTGTSGSVTSTYNAGTGVWTASGLIADVNTLLAGVTFTPTSSFHGNFTISTSISDGSLSATGSKAMTGIGTNNAPVLDATKSPALASINEDASSPSGAVGTLVSSLVDFATPSGQVDNVTDSDAGALLGIAITAIDGANLSCFYTLNGGATWNAFGTISNTNALLLAADSDNRIYCKANPDANGTYPSAITFRAWDRTSGTDGSSASTASSGGSTAFSSATDTAALVVNAVNDAPVLDNTKSPAMTAINENSGAPVGAVGTAVSTLIDPIIPAGGLDNVIDPDSSPLYGIAITAVDSSHLTCYYTTDGGASWAPMGAVSNTTARLLSADTDHRIYCQPAPNYAGTVSAVITFRAWDATTGTDGGLASTSSNGGTTAFSTATDTASLVINSTADTASFITVWKTDNAGTSNSNQITIPAFNDSTYDVDWGDSNTSSNVTGPTTHTYGSAGTYTVTISGTGFKGMAFGLSGDYLKLLEVKQWGTDTAWETMSGAFFGASNMSITASDTPDLSNVTDMQYAFRATNFSNGLSSWDVSHVNSFVGAFQSSTFNGDISGWDTSGATRLDAMFYADASFNQNISSWDTSHVTNFSSMFEGATAFNQNLGTWNIGAATTMDRMFHGDTLSTANYDGTLTGWISGGVYSVHTGVHFDGGNSQFCSIDSWLMFVEVPNIWSITDGGLGNCPMVLTEVTPIPSSVKAQDAVYHFSADSQVDESQFFSFGEYRAGQPGCSNCVVYIDPVAHTVSFSGLRSGDHVDFTITFLTLHGASNSLEVGPFTVKGVGSTGGSVANPALVNSTTGAHPNGTLVISGQTIFLIKDGKRFGFRDPAEYNSYGYKFGQAVQANSADMALAFDDSSILKAMPGTLVIDKSDGRTVYMIGTNYTKRGFVSASVFKDLGYSFKDLPAINLSDYPTGSIIDSAKDSHPEGSLVLDGKTVWWILNNSKKGFESQQVLDTYGFTSSRLVKANAADLALNSGDLVKLRDGTLVNDNGSYYIISDGKKLMFNGSGKASSLGYNLSNFISAALTSYTAGNSL